MTQSAEVQLLCERARRRRRGKAWKALRSDGNAALAHKVLRPWRVAEQNIARGVVRSDALLDNGDPSQVLSQECP